MSNDGLMILDLWVGQDEQKASERKWFVVLWALGSRMMGHLCYVCTTTLPCTHVSTKIQSRGVIILAPSMSTQ